MDVFLRVGDEPVLIASTRRLERAPIPSGLLRTVLDERTTELVPSNGWVGLSPPAGVALLLGGNGDGPRGVLYVASAPTVAYTAEYRAFLDQIAASTSRALTTAHARAVELGEQRHINETLQKAMLQPASDHPTVAARYRPAALNLAVGGDWYDVIDLDEHRRAMVVGDCVGHGLEAAIAMGQLRSAARPLLFRAPRSSHCSRPPASSNDSRTAASRAARRAWRPVGGRSRHSYNHDSLTPSQRQHFAWGTRCSVLWAATTRATLTCCFLDPQDHGSLENITLHPQLSVLIAGQVIVSSTRAHRVGPTPRESWSSQVSAAAEPLTPPHMRQP